MQDSKVEKSLRDVVRARYQEPEFTVNIARNFVIEELELNDTFFKTEPWKSRSKEIITSQKHKCDNGEQSDDVSTKKPKSLKRASPTINPQPRKKTKTVDSDHSSSDELRYDTRPVKKSKSRQPPTKSASASTAQAKKARKGKPDLDEESSTELSDAPEDVDDSDQEPSKAVADDDTSSELSSVIDEPIAPRRKSKAGDNSSKAASKPKKPATETDPNTEEIKKLQGWLVKCGIRKVWGKELKPYETSKAKITHLKSMLTDVGLTGRYSNEKAAQIREARELAADIEAVQEGNERWGKDSGDEEDGDTGRPQRRLIRGAQNYPYLSSDGEETD